MNRVSGRRAAGVFILAGLAFLIYQVLPTTLQTAYAISMKLTGRATICTWPRILRFWPDVNQFARLYEDARQGTSMVQQEGDLELIASPKGKFWVRHENVPASQPVYQIAEHDWVASTNPGEIVQPGEIVIDVGAHVGIFTAKALALGASKVVAVEPDPGNLECLRRNFAPQIASGQVVLVPEGAWSRSSVLVLHLGASSAWNSMVKDFVGSHSIEVPVRKLDDMVRELKLTRVDFIKMDIEGAEREALAGAQETLRTHRPRLMIDSYHLPDDMDVLPPLIRRAHADYALSCGPCEPNEDGPKHLVPHVTFYR
jgi:FkbM family methyltransferase